MERYANTFWHNCCKLLFGNCISVDRGVHILPFFTMTSLTPAATEESWFQPLLSKSFSLFFKKKVGWSHAEVKALLWHEHLCWQPWSNAVSSFYHESRESLSQFQEKTSFHQGEKWAAVSHSLLRNGFSLSLSLSFLTILMICYFFLLCPLRLGGWVSVMPINEWLIMPLIRNKTPTTCQGHALMKMFLPESAL